MKKAMKIACVIVVLLAVAAGGFFAGRATVRGSSADGHAQTFYATIEQIGDGWLLVKGMAVNDINHQGDFHVPVGEDTALVWRYTELLFEELRVGQNVAVTYTGYVLETYPARLTNVLRIELLDDSKELAASSEPEPVPDVVTVVDIVDRTEHEPLVTADVLETFWSDDEYTYYFGSLKSGLIVVHYSDGTQENVREALGTGRVTIADLNRFDIGYYKEKIVTAVGMECKEGVLDAPIIFWSDEEYNYWFPTTGTEVTVHLSDGHSWPLQDALMSGLVTVKDLERYDILYYAEPKK